MKSFPPSVQHCIEALCSEGCQSVRDSIEKLEQGETLPATRALSQDECRLVLIELKAIMAVYDE